MPPETNEQQDQEAAQIAVAIDKGIVDLSTFTDEELELLSSNLGKSKISVRFPTQPDPDKPADRGFRDRSLEPPTGEDILMENLVQPVGESIVGAGAGLLGINDPQMLAEGGAGALGFRAGQVVGAMLPQTKAGKIAAFAIPFLAAGLGGGSANVIGQEVSSPEAEKDLEQAATAAAGAMAGEAILPLAGSAVRLGGSVLKLPGFLLDKSGDLLRKVKGSKNGEEAIQKVADWIDDPQNLSRAFGATPADVNIQREVLKDCPSRLSLGIEQGAR